MSAVEKSAALIFLYFKYIFNLYLYIVKYNYIYLSNKLITKTNQYEKVKKTRIKKNRRWITSSYS